MLLQTIGRTNLYRKPTTNSPVVAIVSLGVEVESVSENGGMPIELPEQANGFVFVADPLDRKGWIERRMLADFARAEIEAKLLVQQAMHVEQVFNDDPGTAPWFVSADFVLARGLIETGLSNAAPRAAGPDGFGPFHVSRDEWKAFLQESGKKKEFSADGWDNPIEQVSAATYRMLRDARALFDAARVQEPDFIPTYLDLFHVYLFDSPAAALLIRTLWDRMLASPGIDQGVANQTVEAALTPAIPTAAFVRLYRERSEFFGTASNPASFRSFTIQTAAVLTQRMKDGFRLIAEFAPELLPAAKDSPPADKMAGTEEGIGDAVKRGGGLLGRLIGSGEGGYRSFNRGRAGDSSKEEIPFETMTLVQVMHRQKKSAPDPILATGKYQIVPDTLAGAVKALKLPMETAYGPETQEMIFRLYLVGIARPAIKGYITGGQAGLFKAQMALAQEFASVGRPDTNRSFYAGIGGNAASISHVRSAETLNAERQLYGKLLQELGEPDKAWMALSTTG